MAGRMCLLDLPTELLETLYYDDSLDFKDVLNLGLTCTTFQKISDSNDLWRQKFRARWPDIYDRYENNQQWSWKKEFQVCHQCWKAVGQELSTMSQRFYFYDNVGDDEFANLAAMLQHHERAPWFVVSSLMETLNDGNDHVNLTFKYYCEPALQFIQKCVMEKEWVAYLEESAKPEALEKGVVMFAQWCQPTARIPASDIHHALDDLANETQACLAARCRGHPACHSPVGNHVTVLAESRWSPQHCLHVMKALNVVMFEKQGFVGNTDDYYALENSYINKVLERRTGIPIALCVVYLSVARRLGVLLEPVGLPAHFMVRLLQHPQGEVHERYTYIDVFNKGRFLAEAECDTRGYPPEDRSIFDPQPPLKVLERMCNNLRAGPLDYRHLAGSHARQRALELTEIICPSLERLLTLARVYLEGGVHAKRALRVLCKLDELCDTEANGQVLMELRSYGSILRDDQCRRVREARARQIETRRRSAHPDVEFSVGLVMTHKRYRYTCVIYGWDARCQQSQAWVRQMGVDQLPLGRNQPFYHVLVTDGTERYAAQENLQLTEAPKVVCHPEVGRYFREYGGKYYRPNAEKEAEYPEDWGHPDSQ